MPSSATASPCSTISARKSKTQPSRARDATFTAQLRKFAVDLRTKDLSASKLEDLLDQYKLTVTP